MIGSLRSVVIDAPDPHALATGAGHSFCLVFDA